MARCPLGIGPQHAGTGCGDPRFQTRDLGAPFDFHLSISSTALRSGRKTFPRRVRRTADPSASLRSGRDDKGEGDGSIKSGCETEAFFHHPWVGRRPVATPVEKHFQERSELQIPPLRSGRDDKGEATVL